MTEKLPHMPLWVYDLEADEDCALMSLAEYGAYMRLLQRQWIEGSIPVDPARLARLLRVTDAQFNEIWLSLSPKFVKDGRGRMKNRRLDEERMRALSKVEANRSNGRKGGRPKKLEQTQRITQEKPNGFIPAYGSGSDSGSGLPPPDSESDARAKNWHGASAWESQPIVDRLFKSIPASRRKGINKFREAVIGALHEGTEPDVIETSLRAYYASPEGKSGAYRNPATVVVDRIWDEDESAWQDRNANEPESRERQW